MRTTRPQRRQKACARKRTQRACEKLMRAVQVAPAEEHACGGEREARGAGACVLRLSPCSACPSLSLSLSECVSCASRRVKIVCVMVLGVCDVYMCVRVVCRGLCLNATDAQPQKHAQTHADREKDRRRKAHACVCTHTPHTHVHTNSAHACTHTHTLPLFLLSPTTRHSLFPRPSPSAKSKSNAIHHTP
eukprot:1200132-Rhodomonas_salina.2